MIVLNLILRLCSLSTTPNIIPCILCLLFKKLLFYAAREAMSRVAAACASGTPTPTPEEAVAGAGGEACVWAKAVSAQLVPALLGVRSLLPSALALLCKLLRRRHTLWCTTHKSTSALPLDWVCSFDSSFLLYTRTVYYVFVLRTSSTGIHTLDRVCELVIYEYDDIYE